MKRLTIYFLAIAIAGTMASCSKSSDPAAPSVVGTWKFTSYVAADCDDPLDEENESCGGTLAECGSLVLTPTNFTNTPGTSSGGSAETGTYAISGTSLTITPSGSTAKTFAFTVNATTLTVSEDHADTGCHSTSTFTRQ